MAAEADLILELTRMAGSAAAGGIAAWLALKNWVGQEVLARATRRTTAMQLLSDEEYTLTRVRDECKLIQHMVQLKQDTLGSRRDHLESEAERILEESRNLLKDVRERRKTVEPKIQTLAAAEIEAVIASAYHGKRMAEAQLQRTLASKNEILPEYGLFGKSPSNAP
ncbi:MAG: hypothetical protein ABL967_19740 [Bryobacteraceae bacterium]